MHQLSRRSLLVPVLTAVGEGGAERAVQAEGHAPGRTIGEDVRDDEGGTFLHHGLGRRRCRPGPQGGAPLAGTPTVG